VPPSPALPGDLSVTLIPDTRIAAPGETIRLDVYIDGAHDVVDVPFTLAYDPTVLEYIGSTEGTFLNMNGDATIFAVSNDPAGGRISLGLSRYLRNRGVDGDGLLATIELKVLTAGSTLVKFDRGAVRDGRGVFLDTEFTGTVVETVGGD
jgi:hypothetical protein